jgi:predicted transcriptional regulator
MFNIKEYREKQNISIKEIADFLEVTRQQVYNIESGKTKLSIDRYLKLKQFLGVQDDTM